MELADVLSDKEPEAPVENVEEAPEKTEVRDEYQSRKKAHQEKEFNAQGLERDPETGQFKKREEKPEVKAEEKPAEKVAEKPAEKPAQQEMTEKEKAFLQGLQEERRKRQELERKIEELSKSKTPEEKKTFWDDPEAALAQHKTEIKSVAVQTRLNTAEVIARSKYQDFDEKIETFKQIVQQTPGLAQQWLAALDPAEFAYRIGKNHKELQEVGSIDQYKQKIEAELRLKLEKEYKEKQEAREKERAAIPPSLSDARGTSQNRPLWNGPTPLDSILSGK